jgi:hypothetical protein
MRKIQKISNNGGLFYLLEKDLGQKAKAATDNLSNYLIETVSQLLGLIQRKIPRVSEKTARIKGLTKSGLALQRKIQPELIISQLQRAMKVSRNDAIRVYNRCIRINTSFQRYNYNSGWAFGSVVNRKVSNIDTAFWFTAADIKIERGLFVVPGYEAAGPVFDQGERGTCVANAFCSSIDYSTGQRSSRQLLYHQAKMIDGIPDEEGTYIEVAARILHDRLFTDLGNVEETIWPYNPYTGSTPHQGPPPEKAFNTKRIYTNDEPVFIRETSKAEDIKYLLNRKTCVRRGFSTENKTSLVVIGVALHESFFSLNTSDTGWVTIPLPGEAIVGYHAMAVCGYDDARELFLVRNSWGPHWAHNNDKGYIGHAWIPYAYIEKFCHVGLTMSNFKTEHMIIPESERLYNKISVRSYSGKIAAARMIKTKNVRRVKKHLSPIGWLFRIFVVAMLGYAFKDPIIRFKDKLKVTIEERLKFSGLKNKVADFFEDNSN